MGRKTKKKKKYTPSDDTTQKRRTRKTRGRRKLFDLRKTRACILEQPQLQKQRYFHTTQTLQSLDDPKRSSLGCPFCSSVVFLAFLMFFARTCIQTRIQDMDVQSPTGFTLRGCTIYHFISIYLCALLPYFLNFSLYLPPLVSVFHFPYHFPYHPSTW